MLFIFYRLSLADLFSVMTPAQFQWNYLSIGNHMEKFNRKTNMTYEQAFRLCQRRRPVVDPIPAFCDQLRKYEKDCREWGYLTAVEENNSGGEQHLKYAEGPNVDTDVRVKSSSGEKRKVDGDDTDVRKKHIVGPMPPSHNEASSIRSTSKPSVGTSVGSSVRKLASIGPMRPAVGPSIGPSVIGPSKPIEPGHTATSKKDDTSSAQLSKGTKEKKRVIGPSMPPQS